MKVDMPLNEETKPVIQKVLNLAQKKALLSLFNGISILLGYLMPKPSS